VLETIAFLSLIVVNTAVIGVGSWLVMDADSRQAWRGRMHSALRGITALLNARFTRSPQQAKVSPAFVGRSVRVRQAVEYVALRKWAAVAIAAMLSIPALLAIVLTSSSRLDGYEDMPTTGDPVVVALLQGEQLVAPPPLPPELFVTKEVEAVRQELAGASREWLALDTEFRRRLLTVYQLMARHGYQMALLEGYRSPERQALLARLGSSVTNAGAYQSYHQYGLAADSAFYRDGKIMISERDPWALEGYRLYGEYAESVGLVWGGRWRMLDLGHVELRRTGTLGRRQSN
jgi:peptidoglycan L-alanyl-D-glutamate endopeptidase CwlK